MRAALVLLAALPLAAQPKLLVNAQTDTRSAAAGLDAAFRALVAAPPQPAWIGYSVPAVRTWHMGCDVVRDGNVVTGVVHLEPPDQVVVLSLRVEGNAVVSVRAVSPDCEIDAGGLPLHWLSDVAPAQSVALLASFAPAQTGAISAIAMHADAAAEAALDRFLAPSQPLSLRERAVSCLGWARGGGTALTCCSAWPSAMRICGCASAPFPLSLPAASRRRPNGSSGLPRPPRIPTCGPVRWGTLAANRGRPSWPR